MTLLVKVRDNQLPRLEANFHFVVRMEARNFSKKQKGVGLKKLFFIPFFSKKAHFGTGIMIPFKINDNKTPMKSNTPPREPCALALFPIFFCTQGMSYNKTG